MIKQMKNKISNILFNMEQASLENFRIKEKHYLEENINL